MTTGATGQLGLALPVQGELSGTWGDTVNNGLTQYINIAIAGTLTLTNDGAVTLANTTGDASASNVTSTLTGAGTVTAQFAIVRVTGTLTTAKVVTAPSYSKTYTVVNAATGGIVTFKASGQTGVSIAVGESAFVYFNGTDYVKVSGTASVTSFSAGTTGLTPSTSTTGAVTLAGTLAIANGGTGQTTANTALNALLPSQTGNANKYLQTDGTNSSWDAVSLSTADITGTLGTANGGTNLTSFTSGGVVYASSTSALATGSALSFNGTNALTVTANSAELYLAGGSSAAQGGFLSISRGGTAKILLGTASNVLGGGSNTSDDLTLFATAESRFYASSAEGMRLTSTGLGIGTSSPGNYGKLAVVGTIAPVSPDTNTQGVFSADNTGKITVGGYNGSLTNYLVFNTGGGTERMRLDSAGNLGIGTSSPAYKLDVNQAAVGFPGFRISGSNSPGMQIAETSGTVTSHFVNDSAGCYFGTTTSHPLVFRTVNTERMRLDSAGNLGVGTTTPDVFSRGYGTTLAVSNTSVNGTSIAINSGTSAYPALELGRGGVRKAIFTASSTVTEFGNLEAVPLAFYTNSTERARIDSSGNLLVGTTTAASKLTVSGSSAIITVDGTTSTGARGLDFVHSGQSYGSLLNYAQTGETALTAGYTGSSGYFMTFKTEGIERARISNTGNLLVGTTSALNGTARLDVSAPSGNNVSATLKNDAGAGQWNTQIWNAGTTGDNAFIQFATETSYTGRGSITYNRAGGLVAYNTTSDYRAKDISGPVTGSGALIDSVPVYMGKMKGATQERPMFIAHETPSYAHTGEKDAVDADGNPVYQQMDASALIPVMWAEIQSLRKRLADAGI